MPRISNKVIYNQDATPNLKDYVIGTDINDFKRTKNYNLKSIFNLFNNANGVSNNLYKFSLVEDEENYLTPGVLSLESTNLNGVFTIYLNKVNTEGTNLSVLFAKMDEGFSGRHHKLRLESASDKNFFINLNIRDMISYADYISIEVELSDAGRIGDLIQESFYVVSFIVDEAHYEISQQIKLDDTEGNIDQLVTSAINKLPRFYVKPNETRSVFVDFVSGNSLYRKHWRLRYSGRYYGVGHPISYHSHIKVDHVEILVQNISNQGNIVDLGEIGSPPLDNEGNPISRELHLSNYINRLGTSITLKLGNVVTALFNTEEYNFYFNGDEALYGINDEETVEENFNEFDSEEVPIDVEVNNGIEPYYISPEPTPQTENFFIDVIVADNINNRAQQIPQSSKLIYIYTLFQYGGQSFRKIWVLDNSNRAYGQGTPPIGAGNLIEFNTQALQQNSVVDLGDIGALVGNDTYEEHLRDYINAQDPSIGLINSGTIRADFGGDVREFNFSNVTGDYGLNVNQTEVTDFQLYGESNNEEDAGTIVTNTSQLVNDGEDGTSRFIEEDELGTIAYEDSNQYIKQQEREIPNGIATLDGAGKLKTDQIPDLAITDVVTPTETTIEAFVTNNANYTYQQGDVIVIDDGSGDVTHNMYKGGDKSLVTSYSEINATEFAISQINGLQGELDNTVKKTGELLQTVQGRVFEFISDNTSNFLRAKNVNGANIALVQTGETGFIQASTSVNQNGRLILSGASGQPLTELKVRIDGSIDNKEIYHEGNLPTSPTGIKADNSVQKTGQTSQTINGTLVSKFKTNGGDGTNLIDDNGDLVPKSTFLTNSDKTSFNLLLGNVGDIITNKAELAAKFTFTENDITSFTIINNDVYALVTKTKYSDASPFFEGTDITKLVETDGFFNRVDSGFLKDCLLLEYVNLKIEIFSPSTNAGFFGCHNIKSENIILNEMRICESTNNFYFCGSSVDVVGQSQLYFPKMTHLIGVRNFRGVKANLNFPNLKTVDGSPFNIFNGEEIITPKLEVLGDTPQTTDLFSGSANINKVVLNKTLATANNGTPHASITELVADNNAEIVYTDINRISELTQDYISPDVLGLSQLGSYANDTDASNGGVEIGEAYFDSTTGYLKRRIS